MGFANSDQLREVFYAGGMGFLLGAYYDVFRIVRRLCHTGKWGTFFCDCVYFTTAAVIVFLFSLAFTDGVVRGYVLLGVLIGFAAYRYTVGRSVLRFFSWIARWGNRAAVWCRRITSVPMRWLSGFFGKLWEKCQKLFKKSGIFFKKGLQRRGKVLYNHNV